MVFVRRIEPEEGETLRELRLAALLDAPSAFSSLYIDESVRTPTEWAELAKRAAAGFERATFLAFDSDEPVGIVGGDKPRSKSPIVELVSMWTRPAVRRTGIGKELVEVVLTWASEGGAEEVGIWVTEGNDTAIDLYTSAGFVTAEGRGSLRPGSSEQVVRMKRSVS